MDVQPLLPSVLTSADTAMLLAASPAVTAAEAAASDRSASSSTDAGTQSKPQGVSSFEDFMFPLFPSDPYKPCNFYVRQWL